MAQTNLTLDLNNLKQPIEKNLNASPTTVENTNPTQEQSLQIEDPKIVIDAAQAINSVMSSIVLTDEEKSKIEQNKKSPGVAPSKKIEIKQDCKTDTGADSGDILKDFSQFVLDKVDIETGDGLCDTLPTGIDLLDTVMGGGFAVGKFSIILGLPGTFKSSLLAQTIGTSQKKYLKNLICSYIDTENAMTTNRLRSMGANVPLMPDVSIEGIFKIIEACCAFKQLRNINDTPSIIAWDSIANTITEKERGAEQIDPNSVMGYKARVLSLAFPKYVTKLEKNNIALISINQLRDKIDMGMFSKQNPLKYLGDKVMPGGMAIEFNAFQIVLLKQREDLDPAKYGGLNGLKLEAKCIKGKLFQPNISINLIVDFNKGFSNFWTNYVLLSDTERLKTGAWNKLLAYPEKLFRTSDAENLYKNDPGFKKAFDDEVQSVLKTEYKDKYRNYLSTEGV